MYSMREGWTDARLDDFADNVDKRFDAVDRRLDSVEGELKALNRTLLQIGGGLIATLIAGFFGVIIALL
jgi:tetrahydromethanopterin S-methyltransferase subunit G